MTSKTTAMCAVLSLAVISAVVGCSKPTNTPDKPAGEAPAQAPANTTDTK